MIRTLVVALCLVATHVLATAAGGLEWQAPAGWKEQAPRPMRAATYGVPAAKGDTDEGELAVFYFGQGQGGGVQENVNRWIGQFVQPDGKPSSSASKTSEKKLPSGLKATLIEVSGTYGGMGGPMAPVKTEKPNYRLLGAIVEGPQGAVFFKLTGPTATVEAARKSFDKLLTGVKKT